MASVEFREVRKSFDTGKTVLDGVSVAVADGEFVSLLGPSGCGKTTLLRILAGLESADSGEVLVGGRDVSELPPKDRDIAMVFQNYALYPHLSVFDNVGMGLKLRGVPAAERRRRVEDAAKRLGLSELLARRPATLSGGQRQRVALARALVRQPAAFLLDEPLSNLDAVLRERTRGELKLLFRQAKGTVVYVTHDQVEAMTLSDRVVVLNHGRVQQVGSPEDIYHRPSNIFVAGFLGSPSMNIFPLTVAEGLGLVLAQAGRPAEKLQCGLRPEDVALSPKEQAGFMEADVTLCEPTGAQTLLTLDMGGLSLRVAVPGGWAPSQASAWIRFPSDRLHFFDGETHERV